MALTSCLAVSRRVHDPRQVVNPSFAHSTPSASISLPSLRIVDRPSLGHYFHCNLAGGLAFLARSPCCHLLVLYRLSSQPLPYYCLAPFLAGLCLKGFTTPPPHFHHPFLHPAFAQSSHFALRISVLLTLPDSLRGNLRLKDSGPTLQLLILGNGLPSHIPSVPFYSPYLCSPGLFRLHPPCCFVGWRPFWKLRFCWRALRLHHAIILSTLRPLLAVAPTRSRARQPPRALSARTFTFLPVGAVSSPTRRA